MSAARNERIPTTSLDASTRPTRDALRPTREPLAPFVPAPVLPSVAAAPRAIMAKSPKPVVAPNPVPQSAECCVVARFPVAQVERAIAVLHARGVRATRVRELPLPGGVARELARILPRATGLASAIGGLGALLGALIVPHEALLPSLGWLPGPVVGATIGAGTGGAIGFVIGALSLVFMPAKDLATLAQGDALLVVRGALPAQEIARQIAELNGRPIATGF